MVGPKSRNPVAISWSRRDWRVSALEQITGNLLGDKVGKRLVGVERPNHVVAITPGMGKHKRAAAAA